MKGTYVGWRQDDVDVLQAAWQLLKNALEQGRMNRGPGGGLSQGRGGLPCWPRAGQLPFAGTSVPGAEEPGASVCLCGGLQEVTLVLAQT